MTQNIHKTACIEDGAIIGQNVSIGPYAIIGPNCVLEDNVTIKGHVYLDGYTRVGEGSTIWPGAVIGTKTQDLKFRGEKTHVIIGKRCDIRECVTINSSCGEGTEVTIGDECLLMAYCHVAHNCTIGKRVIMSNSVNLAGHVDVEDYAVISGLTAVHQFSRIGAYAMIGGMSRVTRDVPPYTIGAGGPYRVGGLNIVGLKRHGFSYQTRMLLSRAFRLLYRSSKTVEEGLQAIENELEQIPEIKHFVTFCRSTRRGLIGMEGLGSNAPSEESQEKIAALS